MFSEFGSLKYGYLERNVNAETVDDTATLSFSFGTSLPRSWISIHE